MAKKSKRGGVNGAGLLPEKQYGVVPIDSIHPHPQNPRQGDVGDICQLIKANGFRGALTVQRSTGDILAGNHRWLAARELGMTHLPVIWEDCDDATALRHLLADNRANDLAAWNDNALAELLQGIQADAGTLAGTGFDGDALDALLADLNMNLGAEPEEAKFEPEKIKGGSVQDLIPTAEECAEFAGKKLLVQYSGGKDSTATAVWVRHYFPDSETELVFVDMGADFVGFHLYLHRAARYLGMPLRILRSPRTVFDVMLERGKWPSFMHPYCHECLHGPFDNHVKQHAADTVIVLRGGRLSERAHQGGKENESRWVGIDGLPGYRYFQPLYFSDKGTSERLLDEADVPIWEGYTRGLQRTACRICPGQKAVSYAAIRANYPDVWAELLELEGRFGPGCWYDPFSNSGSASVVQLADRGQERFDEATTSV